MSAKPMTVTVPRTEQEIADAEAAERYYERRYQERIEREQTWVEWLAKIVFSLVLSVVGVLLAIEVTK